MNVENIRLSERAKTQLITLKRRTGIQHWNVLCRWALCLSFAERSTPPLEDIPADSNVEMTWKTFGGPRAELYLALLKQRALKEGYTLDSPGLSRALRVHLHRGIAYLAAPGTAVSLPHLLATTSPTERRE